ncbi:hypothetical protein N8973_00720, partial [bacterium]|nr:hypothetical protein [bacterium]
VPEWGVFCHTERLRDHPARLNLVLSDSAIAQDTGIISRPITGVKRSRSSANASSTGVQRMPAGNAKQSLRSGEGVIGPLI